MTAPPQNLTLACRCGALRLRVDAVSPAVANRVVCYCAGCRAFAARMDPDILDAEGGTERFQVCPSSVHIDAGAEHLACLQQTRGGGLRWYARCCQAAIGITLQATSVPFVGLDAARIDMMALDRPRDEVLGPVRARVNTPFSRTERRARRASIGAVLAMLAHLIPLTARWWWRGDHRRSPFVSDDGRRPLVDVERLYPAERLRLGSAGCR